MNFDALRALRRRLLGLMLLLQLHVVWPDAFLVLTGTQQIVALRYLSINP